MPVTTSSIIAASGSSRNPQVTWKRPMPSWVASGICGIQSAPFAWSARASPSRPSSCQKATSDKASAAVIIVTATAPDVRRENERMPTRPLIAAPMPGKSGISQMYRMDLSDVPELPGLPPHQVHFVDVDRFFVAVEGEDDAESDRGFGGSDCDHEDREHLANRVLQLIRERD